MKSVFLFFGLTALAAAQPALPELVAMLFAQVRPEMTAQYDAQGLAVRDAYQKTGAQYRMNYRPLFGNTFQYLSTMPVRDVADWENGSDLEKRMGAAAYQKWLPEYRKTISGTARLLVRPIADSSIRDMPVGSLPFVVVQRIRVEFSRRAEFEARSKNAVVPALKKAGVKRYVLSRVVFGGGANEYVSVRMHGSLADAEKGNQVVSGIPIPAGLVLSSERMVFRVNAKTSFSQGVEIR
ncbi:MAG: hypothetical protein JST93_05610 [Acidobacteria bacterium]|nr:hypothetical protein [Acidobacteriota bacterium]